MNTQTALRLRRGLEHRLATRHLLDVVLVIGLFVVSHSVYRASKSTVQLCDSTYSLVVAEQFLANGSLDVREHIPADAVRRQALPGYNAGQDLPYHLVRRPDPQNTDAPARINYGYPLGSSMLSLPFVWHYSRHKNMSAIGPDGVPSYTMEGIVQQRIASVVVAGIVVLCFFIARFFCSAPVSGLIAAGFAFGSPLWSTLARALWSHTWMAFWLTAAIVLLIGARRIREATWRHDFAVGCGLGTALFWALFCRQHAAISSLAIGVYLLIANRRLLVYTVLVGGAWSASLVSLSLAYFGTPMPPSVYASGMIDFQNVANRFTWLMISPTRGLLVYCPYLAVVGVLLMACRKHLQEATLLLPAGLAIMGHSALLSCYDGWHANWAYGPRYFCDVLPWFVLLTAMAVQGLCTMPCVPWRKSVAIAALASCFAWGGFVHYRGASVKAAWHWNDLARTLGNEGSVKDWRHPQFLTGLTFEVNPDGTVLEK